MKTRLVTAAVMLALFLPILWFSHIFWLYAAAMSLLCVFAAYEYLNALGYGRDLAVSLPVIALLGALPFLGVAFALPEALSAALLGLLLLFLYLSVVLVLRDGALPFSGIVSVAGGALYIGGAFLALTALRTLPGGGAWYLLPMIGAWITDTFAYFTGRFFGKHKLIPSVSPKKTVEGSLGGILFCTASFPLFGLIARSLGWGTPSFIALTIAGFLVSFVSQAGDLVMSKLKREQGIKDFGRIFPGHGGVLDRFDSVIATAPFILLFYWLGGFFLLFT